MRIAIISTIIGVACGMICPAMQYWPATANLYIQRPHELSDRIMKLRTLEDGLTLHIILDRATIRSNERLKGRYLLRNSGKKDIVLSRKIFLFSHAKIFLFDANREPVRYKYFSDMARIAQVQGPDDLISIPPGHEYGRDDLIDIINQDLNPGVYTLIAYYNDYGQSEVAKSFGEVIWKGIVRSKPLKVTVLPHL